jgi:hypothetical protein
MLWEGLVGWHGEEQHRAGVCYCSTSCSTDTLLTVSQVISRDAISKGKGDSLSPCSSAGAIIQRQ